MLFQRFTPAAVLLLVVLAGTTSTSLVHGQRCSEASNTRNPYDGMGAYHNDILFTVVRSEDTSDRGLTLATLDAVQNGGTTPRGIGFSFEAPFSQDVFLDRNYPELTLEDFGILYAELIAAGTPAPASDFILALLTTVWEYQESGSDDIQSFYNNIMLLEAQLGGRGTYGTLPDGWKVILYYMSSVARYSGCFHDYFGNGTRRHLSSSSSSSSLRASNTQQQQEQRRLGPTWQRLVSDDLVGGYEAVIASGLVGLIVGEATGGTATGATFAIGAVMASAKTYVNHEDPPGRRVY